MPGCVSYFRIAIRCFRTGYRFCLPKTQNDKSYWIPDVGEQVVCLMDEYDEAGAVLGAIYSSADIPPVQSADKYHISFKDGANMEYDRAAHALVVSLPSGATLNLSANGASVAIDGNGNITVHAAGGINLITSAHRRFGGRNYQHLQRTYPSGPAGRKLDTAEPADVMSAFGHPKRGEGSRAVLQRASRGARRTARDPSTPAASAHDGCKRSIT